MGEAPLFLQCCLRQYLLSKHWDVWKMCWLFKSNY